MSEVSGVGGYQDGLRVRFLAAAQEAAPAPWVPAERHLVLVGGLIGAGFAVDPETGRDLLLVASHNGLGLLDPVTGARLARDYDTELAWPDGPHLTCGGIGAIAGMQVPMAGLLGGGLHTVASDGWSVDVVSPDWPDDRVLLSAPQRDPYRGEHGTDWWHIFHSTYSELRAAGFSPSGNSLVVATSSDVTLWTRVPV